jgi:hypothetical protein
VEWHDRQAEEVIEIPRDALLDYSGQLVKNFRKLVGSLRIGLSWHHLDLVWSTLQLGQIEPNMTIFDAGEYGRHAMVASEVERSGMQH